MRQLFKILDDFSLLDQRNVNEVIEQLDESSLTQLLESIERYYQENLVSTIKDVQMGEGFNIYLSHVPAWLTPQFFRVACLYADRLIIWDTLYELLSSLQMGISSDEIKQRLAPQLKFFSGIRDLAEHNLLALIPHTAYSHEDVQNIAEISTRDIQDHEFQKICFKNMRLEMDKRITTEGWIYSIYILTLGSGFHIKRNAHWSIETPFQNFYFPAPVSPPFLFKTPEGLIEFKPKRVPLLESIESDWKPRKFANAMIYNTARELNFDHAFSEYFNANYFTDFDVYWQLLNWRLNDSKKELDSQGRISKVFSSILKMDLKFLDEIPLKRILEFREREKDAFEEFRLQLNEICNSIRSMPYTKDFEREAKNLKKEKIEPELRRLGHKFHTIKGHKLLGGVAASVATCSMVASVLTGWDPSTLSTGLGAIITAVKGYTDYRREANILRQNPMFFLWNVKK